MIKTEGGEGDLRSMGGYLRCNSAEEMRGGNSDCKMQFTNFSEI